MGGLWGCIDRSGRLVVDLDFDKAGSFVEGLAPVKLKGKWGYIEILK